MMELRCRVLRWSCVPLALLAIAAARPAEAQVTDGRLRLGIEVGLLDVVARGYTADDSDQEIAEAQGSFGLAVGRVNYNVGFGLSELLMLGGRLQIGNTGFVTIVDDEDGPTTGIFSLAVWPYLEFNVGDPDSLQWFLGPMLGLIVEHRQVEDRDANETLEEETLGMGGLGAVVGLRLFVSEMAALEGALQLRFAGGSSKFETDELDIEEDLGQFELLVTIGGSLWFGGDPPRSSEPEPSLPTSPVYQYHPSTPKPPTVHPRGL
ncbi:MAG: hypothetical protein OXU20_09360 [Myxococcales bacterium]|nr:hypothetical protein [Myxococcales bacterium]